MKILIAALFLISASSFASDLDATQALTQILPAGNYSGQTPKGEACEIGIISTEQSVIVMATVGYDRAIRNIERGSTYRWNPGNRSFLSSDIIRNNDDSIEYVFRTIAVENKTQYIVVSEHLVTSRQDIEHKIECVVNL